LFIKKDTKLYNFLKRNLSRKKLHRLLKPGWLYFLSRSLDPISPRYGKERGRPIDRYYIEKFLSDNSPLITGDCLEIEDSHYTTLFGQNISKSDILDVDTNNREANFHADLRNMPEIADNSYDSIILTQVLLYVDDYESAIKECKRILKPEGNLLVILPSMGRIDVRAGIKEDYWRFTRASTQYIFRKFFSKEKIEIKTWGNVLIGIGFWSGQSQEEFSKKQLDYVDPNFPVIVTIKATK
jgi:SAM-dependent methyltransferase